MGPLRVRVTGTRYERTGAGEEPTAGERVVETTMPDTAHRLDAGHRLQLQVSGGARPRYARNHGQGAAGPGEPRRADVHQICHGSAAP